MDVSWSWEGRSGSSIDPWPLSADQNLRAGEQLADPNDPLLDIDGTHYHALPGRFRNYKYHYSHDKIILYVFSTVNRKGTTYLTAMLRFAGIRLMNDGYCMIMLDG